MATLSATPVTVPGSVTPTGTVTFTSGTTTLCTAPVMTLAGSHVGQLPVPPIVLGASTTPYGITANYSGDANVSSSSGTAAAALTVTPAASSTSVASPAAYVTFGNESIDTLSATVSKFPTGGHPDRHRHFHSLRNRHDAVHGSRNPARRHSDPPTASCTLE